MRFTFHLVFLIAAALAWAGCENSGNIVFGDDDDATGDDDTSADCPGGGGEMVCCDEGELLCGTTASAYGEDCCVSGEICEQCWSPDDEEYGGLCIPVGADCPYEAEPE